MDGEHNGKPLKKWDDLGGPTPIFGNTHILLYVDPNGFEIKE